jgi:hypothetical protein
LIGVKPPIIWESHREILAEARRQVNGTKFNEKESVTTTEKTPEGPQKNSAV